MSRCNCRSNRSNCRICYPTVAYAVPVRECNSSLGSGVAGERGPQGIQGIQGPAGTGGGAVSVIQNGDGSYSVTVGGVAVGVPIPGPVAP